MASDSIKVQSGEDVIIGKQHLHSFSPVQCHGQLKWKPVLFDIECSMDHNYDMSGRLGSKKCKDF